MIRVRRHCELLINSVLSNQLMASITCNAYVLKIRPAKKAYDGPSTIINILKNVVVDKYLLSNPDNDIHYMQCTSVKNPAIYNGSNIIIDIHVLMDINKSTLTIYNVQYIF